MVAAMNIILASQSPRRRELLERMGLTAFQIISPDVDEQMPEGTPPADLVEGLSAQKAAAVALTAPSDALIIAADTVVALDDHILGKPADEADAARMLSALSNRTHHVYTGVTVRRGDHVITEHECTAVTFRSLSPTEISAYIKTGEPMDKAGSYGIQSLGSLFVSSISGDYCSVMGLPVCRLYEILRRFDITLLV
jgi:septum formation protein